MLVGAANGYEHKMKIVYPHFPIKTSIKGDTFVIENFLGEKHPRIKIEKKGKHVVVSSELPRKREKASSGHTAPTYGTCL